MPNAKHLSSKTTSTHLSSFHLMPVAIDWFESDYLNWIKFKQPCNVMLTCGKLALTQFILKSAGTESSPIRTYKLNLRALRRWGDNQVLLDLKSSKSNLLNQYDSDHDNTYTSLKKCVQNTVHNLITKCSSRMFEWSETHIDTNNMHKNVKKRLSRRCVLGTDADIQRTCTPPNIFQSNFLQKQDIPTFTPLWFIFFALLLR